MTFFLAHGGGCSTTVAPVDAVVGGRGRNHRGRIAIRHYAGRYGGRVVG